MALATENNFFMDTSSRFMVVGAILQIADSLDQSAGIGPAADFVEICNFMI